MSRSIKGHKGAGYEYWGKRPGPRDPGKYSKKVTHRAERRQGKRTTKIQED